MSAVREYGHDELRGHLLRQPACVVADDAVTRWLLGARSGGASRPGLSFGQHPHGGLASRSATVLSAHVLVRPSAAVSAPSRRAVIRAGH